MIDTATVLQAIQYLLSKLGKADKIKIVKMIYLADKYSLIHFARTITGDEYWAMQLGPVGSTTLDILDFNPITFSESELEMIGRSIEKCSDTVRGFKPSDTHFNLLSDTDKASIDFIVDHFRQTAPFALAEYTHKYPEWKQYEEIFRNQKSRRIKLNTQDLLSILSDPSDPLFTSSEIIEESKKIILGID